MLEQGVITSSYKKSIEIPVWAFEYSIKHLRFSRYAELSWEGTSIQGEESIISRVFGSLLDRSGVFVDSYCDLLRLRSACSEPIA